MLGSWFSLACSLGLTAAPQSAPATEVELAPASVASEVKSWTIRSGLPQNEVTALEQARDGRLWIATFGGLARFDGLRFEVFDLTTNPGLGSNRIVCLHETRDGTLWIGSEEGGLVRFADGEFTPFEDYAGEGVVWSLFEDSRGRLWIGDSNGMSRVEEGLCRRVPDFSEGIRGFAEGPDGALWIATPGGLWTCREGALERAAAGTYFAILAARDGSLWAAPQGSARIERWRGRDVETFALPRALDPWALIEDQSGAIWIASAPALVVRAGSIEERNVGLAAGSLVRTLFEDREGSVWLGGPFGLKRVRPAVLQGYPLRDSLGTAPAILAWDAAGGDAALWVAVYSGRMLHFENGAFRELPLMRAESFARALDGALWTADESTGIARLEGQSALLSVPAERLLPGRKSALLEDSSGALWVAVHDGLQRIRGEQIDTWGAPEGLPAGRVGALAELAPGEIWAGSLGGLARLVDGEVERVWLSAGELPPGSVRAIHAAGDDVWVGLYGGGLCRVDASDRVRALGPAQGLYEAVVSFIAADGPEHLVLLGNRAVSRVALAELDAVADGRAARVHPRVFDSGPGIDIFEGNGGATTAGARTPDGKLWFPARGGIVSFDPAALTTIEVAPEVSIERVLVDGKEAASRGSVLVPPGDRNLEIQFTAATFVEPERMRFRYRLEHYDRDWIEADARRSAVYTRVPPGEYRFEVLAANRDGVWSEVPATLAFELRPHWYEALWFRALAAALAAAAISSLIALRLRGGRLRARALEQQIDARTAELRAARDQLEADVERRTAELAQALASLQHDVEQREALEHQLRESQKFEAVGRLAGGLAHDFNNILTVVLANAGIVRRALEDEDAPAATLARHIAEIQDASVRAAKLTRQLLAYSRRQVLRPKVLAVNDTIAELRAMLRRLVREDIELDLELSSAAGCACVDPGQLEQVIVNLVVNASDACKSGDRITIRTTHVDLDEETHALQPGAPLGPHVAIAVSDTGSGIDAEVIDHVFDPFFTTKHPDKGTGLGLASVHGIVEQSGGRIHVHSARGRGSVFEVFFPSVPCVPDEPPPANHDASTLLRGATILVCDDEAGIARVTGIMLKHEGFEVLVACDANDALELARARSGPIDLLITDVVMPGLNGRDLALRLRAARPELGVIYVSGYSADVLDEERANSAVDFLQKPFTREQLLRRVNQALSRPRAASPGARGKLR